MIPGLIIGFGVGLVVGVFAMALLCIAKQGDEAAERMASAALRDVDLSGLE